MKFVRKIAAGVRRYLSGRRRRKALRSRYRYLYTQKRR